MSASKTARPLDGWSVEINRDIQVIYSDLPEPNPRWSYTDKAGHKHRYGRGKYPTLKWVEDKPYWCCECNDEHERGHYECKKCGEAISPGTRPPDPAGEAIPGRWCGRAMAPNGDEYDLTGEEIAAYRDHERLAAMLLAREPNRRMRRLTYGA